MTLNLKSFFNLNFSRIFCIKNLRISAVPSRNIQSTSSAELDLSYLCDPANVSEIDENIKLRESNGNIKMVHELYNKYMKHKNEKNWNEFMTEALKIPNKTLKHRENNELLLTVGSIQPGEKMEFSEICKKHNWCRTERLSNVSGHRAYYFLGEIAELESALIRLAVKTLLARGFSLVSVPDILPAKDIENCGMPTTGERTQVYRLDPRHGEDLCLSGTAEMALAARLANARPTLDSLPLRLAAVSRCFRAETSSVVQERGIYRVHQFTKVEMFGVTKGGGFEASQALQKELVNLQVDLFTSLGLHFRVLSMASWELGNPAVSKMDLEAWLPGRKIWGELCSCSDCGDFQSRRHDLRIDEDSSFAHTVNGTACAIPRTIMALVETHQNSDGTVTLPEPLKEIMNRDVLGHKDAIKMPDLRYLKVAKR